MEEYDLGPNGGLVYCMEYLLANFSWLEDKLKQLGSQYVLFDCPGQVSNTLPFRHEHHISNVNSNLSKKKTTYSIRTLPIQSEHCLFNLNTTFP
jgi:GPN-loop GTPase